jgi:hypothetical protein
MKLEYLTNLLFTIVPFNVLMFSAFLGVRQMGHEANPSPSSSAEVKRHETMPLLPHTSAWCAAWSSTKDNLLTYLDCNWIESVGYK